MKYNKRITFTEDIGRLDKDAEMQLEVNIDTEREYGHFELYDVDEGGMLYYEEGGLWFEGKELVDYDGTPCIHDRVLDILDEWDIDTQNMR